MKKRILLFLFTALLIGGSNFVQAQNLQEILDRHFEAVGQQKLLDKDTYSIHATIQQMGMEIPMIMKLKRPNKFRIEMEMQGQKMVQVFDGEKGWMHAPWMSPEPQELSGSQLSQAMQQANFDGELYNYEKNGYQASLVGKVDVEGAPMYNIKLTGGDGTVKNYFLGVDDYFIKKITARINAQGQDQEMEQKLSGYKDFDGIKMPTKIDSKNPMGSVVVNFDKISFSEKFDDSTFSKP